MVYEFCLIDLLFIMQPLHELLCSTSQSYHYLVNKFIIFSQMLYWAPDTCQELYVQLQEWLGCNLCSLGTGPWAGSSLSMKWLMNKIFQVSYSGQEAHIELLLILPTLLLGDLSMLVLRSQSSLFRESGLLILISYISTTLLFAHFKKIT